MPNISVIIPSFQSQKIIDKVLNAVFSQNTKILYEVILVDSSPGEEVDLISRKYESLHFLKQQTQTSASKARNIGANASKGELLLFLDSDVTLAKDAIEKVWECYQKGYKVFSGSFSLDSYFGFSLCSFIEFCFFLSESLPNNPNKSRRNLPSGVLAIEKTLFDQYGPFKEYGRAQDTQLTEKIRNSGYILHYCPEIKAKLFQEVSIINFFKKCKLNGINICYIRAGEQLSIAKRIVIFLLLPFISFLKFMVMLYRNLFYRSETKEKFLLLFITPLLAIGILFWFLGGMTAVFINPGVIKKRENSLH